MASSDFFFIYFVLTYLFHVTSTGDKLVLLVLWTTDTITIVV